MIRAQELSGLTLQERALLEQQLLTQVVESSSLPIGADLWPKPLSLAQESLWFFDQLLPNSPLYNIPQAFRLRGKLEPGVLEEAFQILVARHQALQTRFLPENGVPRQVLASTPFKLERVDLSPLPPTERAKEAARLLEEEAKQPFSLSQDLLIRGGLIQLGDESWVLMTTLHHIISDFASLAILWRELSALYRARLDHQQACLPNLPVQFPELAARQRKLAEVSGADPHLGYWKERLSGLPILKLPTDHPRPAARTFNGSRRPVHIPAGLTAALRELASERGVTVYILLLAAFNALLLIYSGQDYLVVGSPVSQRQTPEAQQLIGFLLNTVLLRTDLSGDPNFTELLQRTREVVIGAFAHNELPFEKLVESFKFPRQSGVNPLCQVVFQYLPAAAPAPSLPGVTAEVLPIETGTAKFEHTLTLSESGHALAGELEYNTDLFDSATVDRMLANFGVLLESVVANPAERISRLRLLSESERKQVLVTWNETASPYPLQACVHELFQEQVQRTPEAVAVIARDETLTYQELNRRANRLARFLVQTGVKPGEPVALALERSSEMIVALLAILKAGAAYVPLDATYPAERVRQMLHDANTSTLLTNGKLDHLPASGIKLIRLDLERGPISSESGEDLPKAATATDLAYIMFTSGSTGRPKGVAIPHRGVVRLVKCTNYANFGPEEVFLQFAPLSFDASTFEIWGPLLNGARLVLFPPEFESLEQLARVIEEAGVTTAWLTAGLFHQMVDQHLGSLHKVRQLLAGGDVLSVPHVMKVLEKLPHCQLINGYGPTENTTFSCCFRFPGNWKGASAPIGKPVSNTQVYLLDQHLAPVPIGVVGDLYLAGDGLALGYCHDRTLTDQCFLSNPFASEPGARLYQTGDRARYLADGTLEFAGRLDDQVKINGFRVHLSEVEAGLLAIPGVRQAAVLAQADPFGVKQLIAYLGVERPGELTTGELRGKLLEKLPAYMAPSRYVVLESLPLTPNGKLDRHALAASRHPAAPTDESAGHRSVRVMDEGTPPPDPVQHRILGIWREVFARNDIGIDDSFFDLGGHSLIATRVISRVNQTFQVNVSLSALFDAPTVRAFAEKVLTSAKDTPPGPIKRRQHR